MEIITLFAPGNPPHWGTLASIYLFLASASAGSLFISILSPVFGWKTSSSLTRPGACAALLLLLLAPVPLLLELGQPGRFLNLLNPANFNPRSPMSWGSWFLVLYGLALLIYIWILQGGRPVSIKPDQAAAAAEFPAVKTGLRPWGIVTLLLALGIPLYTGTELAVVKAKAAWNSPLVPFYMLTSAVALGAALVGLGYVVSAARSKTAFDSRPLRDLGLILMAALIITLVSLFLQQVVLSTGTAAAQEAASLLFSNALYLFGVLLVGTLLPLILLFLPGSDRPGLFVITSLLVVLGTLLFRYDLVVKGNLASHLWR
ncbi:MAG: polysulfide reductase NrfD [Firmicutes bacterium]|nr:polysulfide reductase NrfD [Bacillota bacterium]MCL5039549.1 polysulfide reductase NrfD [Bacillota bacterium]